MASKRICSQLYEELVDEILLRLPVKSLLVCKCVCKAWCALIKSPSFVNRHFSHESNRGFLVFLHTDGDVEKKGEYSMYDDGRHCLVEAPDHVRQISSDRILLGPEKGIFCVKNAFSTRIGLLNLATIELKILPPHPLNDPFIGFGLDPCSGDFKVVAFEKSKFQNSAFVYNLSCDSWKRVETLDLLDKIVYFDCMGIPVVNGVKHWLVKFDNHDVHSILAFDMRSDKFRVIAIPDALRNKRRRPRITAYGDSIAVLSYSKRKCIELWVMGSDGLWSKNLCVGPFEGIYTWPICLWKKNKVFLRTISSPLIMCDISTQKFTIILPGMSGEAINQFVCDHFIYKESLVSIKGERANCIQDLF